MMREIKFRAWDSGFQEMQQFDINSGLSDVLRGNQTFDGQIVMQYTGLKDRSGVKIYEGDVVIIFHRERWEPLYPYEVYFSYGAFSLRTLKTHYYKAGVCHYADDRIEVIGNIHENPELMKGK